MHLWSVIRFGQTESLDEIIKKLQNVGLNASKSSTVHGEGIEIDLHDMKVYIVRKNGFPKYMGIYGDKWVWRQTDFTYEFELFYALYSDFKAIALPPFGVAVNRFRNFLKTFLDTHYYQDKDILATMKNGRFIGLNQRVVYVEEKTIGGAKYRNLKTLDIFDFAGIKVDKYYGNTQQAILKLDTVLNDKIVAVRAFQSDIYSSGYFYVRYLGFPLKS